MELPSADQLRHILEGVRELMSSHEQVLDDSISVRFDQIIDGSAVLRLDAGVNTTDFQEFLVVAEELNLGIVEIGEQAGARFSGPGRLVQMQAASTTDSLGQPG